MTRTHHRTLTLLVWHRLMPRPCLRLGPVAALLFFAAQVPTAAPQQPAQPGISPETGLRTAPRRPAATQLAFPAALRSESSAVRREFRPPHPPGRPAVTFEDHFTGPQLDPHWIAKGGGSYQLSGGHLQFTTEAGDLGPGNTAPRHLFLMEIPAEMTRWTAVARVRYAGASRPYEQVCLVAYIDNSNCLKAGYNCGGDIRGIGTLWHFYGYNRGREYKGGYEVPRCDDYFWLRLVREGNQYRAYASNDLTQDAGAVRWVLIDTHMIALENRFVGIGGWNSGAGGQLAEFDYFRFNEGVPDPISRFDQSLQEVCMSLDNADPEEFGHLLYWTTLWAHENPQWLSEFVRRRRSGEPSLALIRGHLASPEMLQYACRRCGAQGPASPDPVEFVRTAYRELLVRDPLLEDENRCLRALAEGASRSDMLRGLLASGEAACRAAERVLRIIQARDARNIRPKPMPQPVTRPSCTPPTPCEVMRRETRPRDVHKPTFGTVSAILAIRTRTEGLIERVLVKPGQRVAENEVLVQLDQEETELELRKARIVLKAAANEFDRCKEAHARGILDSQEMSEAETEMRLAEIECERCQNHLRRLRVVSPAAGIIVHVEEDLQGRKVQAGDLLVRLQQRP